jgi:hypothetical protein
MLPNSGLQPLGFGMAAPIDAAAALLYNQSIITLADLMGVEPGTIFNPIRELRTCLNEVHEHVITFDHVASPAPARLHGPKDCESSYWVKVSSADELLMCCADAPQLRNHKRLLHIHLLPTISFDDANTIDDWEQEEDCNNIRIYVVNRVQTLCKIDALASLDSIREVIRKTKEKIEVEYLRLRLLAIERSKDVDRLHKSHAAYVAVRDSKGSLSSDLLNIVRDEAIIASRPFIVAKMSHMKLTHAAAKTRSLVDFLGSKVDRIDEMMKTLTLMGCGHPDDGRCSSIVWKIYVSSAVVKC